MRVWHSGRALFSLRLPFESAFRIALELATLLDQPPRLIIMGPEAPNSYCRVHVGDVSVPRGLLIFHTSLLLLHKRSAGRDNSGVRAQEANSYYHHGTHKGRAHELFHRSHGEVQQSLRDGIGDHFEVWIMYWACVLERIAVRLVLFPFEKKGNSKISSSDSFLGK